MSEFQFYGFRSIDRNLNKQEREIVQSWSSRASVTASSATFIYNYGDFKKDDEQVLEEYFDAMIYYANWGTKKLMFRLPKEAVDYWALKQYESDNSDEFDIMVGVFKKKEHVIVKIEYHEEEGFDYYEDPEEYFSVLEEWRQMLMDGDYRLLFLAWLFVQSTYENFSQDEWDDEDEKQLIPPIPPKLQKLNGALKDFINFYKIDNHWLDAALYFASQMPESKEVPPTDYVATLNKLSEEQKNDFLARLLSQEVNLHLKLKKELDNLTGNQKQLLAQGKWTTEDLRMKAIGRQKTLIEKEKQLKEEAKRAKMEALIKKELTTWKEVEDHINRKNYSGYMKAIELLQSLKELAVYQNKEEDFNQKLAIIKQTHSRKGSFIQRLEQAF